ncbi:unnamed protein product [Prunus armeniaca]
MKPVLKWSGWCIAKFYPLDFPQNTPHHSIHRIMLFLKFWTKCDIDWSTKLDNSSLYEVRYDMVWLVYGIGLSIGFH